MYKACSIRGTFFPSFLGYVGLLVLTGRPRVGVRVLPHLALGRPPKVVLVPVYARLPLQVCSKPIHTTLKGPDVSKPPGSPI